MIWSHAAALCCVAFIVFVAAYTAWEQRKRPMARRRKVKNEIGFKANPINPANWRAMPRQ